VSNISDDKLVNEYLSGDAPYSARYRELPADDVPAELDAIVLAQATAAVKTAPSTKLKTWRRWTLPTTLAATFVLVISLVIKNNVQQPTIATPAATDITPPQAPSVATQFEESQAAPAAAQEPIRTARTNEFKITPAPAPMRAKRQEPVEVTIDGRITRGSVQDSPAVTTAITEETAQKNAATERDSNALARATRPAPAAPNEALDSAVSLEEVITTARRRAPTSGGPRATVGARSDISEEMEAKLDREADPEQWLQYIRELRAADKPRIADGEWQSFRKRYPRFEIDANDPARPGHKP